MLSMKRLKFTLNARFTLIEMLVVISIIAILASLMMPCLKKAIESGRSIACINRLRQIYIAVTNYANDYSDYIPTSSYGSDASTGRWHKVLNENSYLDKNIFLCPSMTTRPTVWFDRYPDYGINVSMAPMNKYYKISAQKYPSLKMYILDGWQNNTDGTSNRESGFWRIFLYLEPTNDWFGRAAGRHLDKCNILHLDGIVRIYPIYLTDYPYEQKPFRWPKDAEYIGWDTPSWSLVLN